MSKLFMSLDINIRLKRRILRCNIFSTFLYRGETWALKKDFLKKL